MTGRGVGRVWRAPSRLRRGGRVMPQWRSPIDASRGSTLRKKTGARVTASDSPTSDFPPVDPARPLLNRQLRIAQLAPREGTCGYVPTEARNLHIQFARLGWKAYLLDWGREADSESLLRKVLRRPADILETAGAIDPIAPDVVLVHTGLDWRSLLRDLAFRLVTLRRSWKLVLMPHGGHTEWTVKGTRHVIFRWMARWMLNRCDGVLVLSREERDDLVGELSGVPVWVVDNPFVPMDGAASSRGDRVLSDPATVLFVGRLVREKGVFDLVEALALDADQRSFRLVIAGDGSDMNDLTRLIDERGVADRVDLLGWTTGERLSDAYSAADVFAFPTWFAEGFPTVVSEAMSHSLPVVCTAKRGLSDKFVDGVNAVFVPPKDPAAIHAAILRVVSDRELAAGMVAANMGFVSAFAPESVVGAYDDALRQVVLGS